MTEKAQLILEELKETTVEPNMYQKFEKDAKRNWDIFYKNNKTNFYKDRHYIKAEFSEMSKAIEQDGREVTLLDAGCGVGNGFYPLYADFEKGKLRI